MKCEKYEKSNKNDRIERARDHSPIFSGVEPS
jgi:hypothetical protein